MAAVISWRRIVSVTAFILAAIILFNLGIGIAHGKYRDCGLALQIIPHVKFSYIKPVTIYELIRTYIREGNVQDMLAGLGDPYTRYLNKQQFAELLTETEGSYGGVGIYLDYKDNQLIIMRPMKGTPGEKAGLIQGDKIIAIDGESTRDMAQEVAVAKIRGPAGTKVTLTIERRVNKTRSVHEVVLERTIIKIPTVEWRTEKDPVIGKIGRVSIYQFGEKTAEDLHKAMSSFEKENVSGIILDLRYNPGGLLTSAVEVAGEFLTGGPVVFVKHRVGEEIVYTASPNPHRIFPLVVLVNEWSASASEIVAGAIKDRGAGTLVGNTTFGKGVVQDVIPLAGGGALTLTVANYLTAGGKYIHGKGIEPDILVGSDREKEEIVKKSDAKFEISTEEREEIHHRTLEELKKIDKLQEDKAVEVLREKVLKQREEAAA